MTKIICKCGKGYASDKDNLCCFCREGKYAPTRAQCRKFNIKRGQGLPYYKYKGI